MNYRTLFQGHFQPHQIQVHIEEAQRKTDDYIENNIELEWSKRVKKYPQVFNGICYRLLSFTKESAQLSLHLSTTTYKEAKGIPVSYVLKKNEAEYFPHALACSVFLKTKDGEIIWGKSAGKDRLVGGSYSPEECLLHDGLDIFQMAYLELLQEVGIEASAVSSMVLVGAVLMDTLNVSLIFEGTVDLTSEEVSKCFEKRHDPELDDLMFVSTLDMPRYVQQYHEHKRAIWDCLSIY